MKLEDEIEARRAIDDRNMNRKGEIQEQWPSLRVTILIIQMANSLTIF